MKALQRSMVTKKHWAPLGFNKRWTPHRFSEPVRCPPFRKALLLSVMPGSPTLYLYCWHSTKRGQQGLMRPRLRHLWERFVDPIVELPGAVAEQLPPWEPLTNGSPMALTSGITGSGRGSAVAER